MYADATDTAETSIDLLREFERTGDASVFETFMRRHAAMVYATCLKVTRDPHDAEDATQATFLTLASKSRLNGEIRQPEAWIRKVAHRLSLDLIRSRKRRANRENIRSEMTNEAAPLDSSDHADNGEVKGILNEELAKLPASYRMPLILHYFGGLSREEMAEQLKLKPSTLGVRLHRAREQLRKRLASRGVAVPTLTLGVLLGESIRAAVSGHMVTATAQQASIIAGGSLAPFSASAALPFASGPSASMFASVLNTLARSKVKLIASTVILGSIIGVSSARVQSLLPDALRAILPTFSLPSFSLPSFEHVVPVPTFGVKPPPATPARIVAFDAGTIRRHAPVETPPPPIVLARTPTPASGAPQMVESPAAAPVTLARIDAGLAGRLTPQATREASTTSANAARAATFATASIGMLPSHANAGESSSKANESASPAPAVVAPAEAGGYASWGSILGDHGVALGPRAAENDVDAGSERLVAAVVGTSPLSAGGGGGGGSSSKSQPAKGNAAAQSVTKSRETSRTAIFAGTSANYGGYADDDWKNAPIADLSNVVQEKPTYSFDQPIAPTSGLSINGARVTLHGPNVTSDPTIAFVEPDSGVLPTLPTGHHFIGAWSLTSATPFDSADILVRYDDLRAARLGLSEQILKLWVSDGKTWTLLWHDPTFGRDINQNLIWVTAAGGFKYFAVSAPEPSLMTAIVGAFGLVARRRRRR